MFFGRISFYKLPAFYKSNKMKSVKLTPLEKAYSELQITAEYDKSHKNTYRLKIDIKEI